MESSLYDTKYQTVQVISVTPCSLLNRYQNVVPLLSGYKGFVCWRSEIGNFNTVHVRTGLQFTRVEFVKFGFYESRKFFHQLAECPLLEDD